MMNIQKRDSGDLIAAGTTQSELRESLQNLLDADERITTRRVAQAAGVSRVEIGDLLCRRPLSPRTARHIQKTLIDLKRSRNLRAEREYVHSEQLATHITEFLAHTEDCDLTQLAERAGVTRRAIRIVLDNDRPYATVFLADALMMAMGKHIGLLETFYAHPSKNNHVGTEKHNPHHPAGKR